MSGMPAMPEPIRITKKETFAGVEMETIYRQGKTPIDPKDENRDAEGAGMSSMGMGGSRAQTWCKSVLRSVAASPDVTPS